MKHHQLEIIEEIIAHWDYERITVKPTEIHPYVCMARIHRTVVE
jgi:hypothetical protein